MIVMTAKGSFKNSLSFLKNGQNLTKKMEEILNSYGQKGVQALSQATPKATGLTASSWTYEVSKGTLTFYNKNVTSGPPIAVLIQYGHATRNGGYVQGRDYINPVLQPIFDDISKALEKEVQSL